MFGLDVDDKLIVLKTAGCQIVATCSGADNPSAA